MTKIFEGTEEELRKNLFAMDKLNQALIELKANDWKYYIGTSGNSYCLVKINSKGRTEVIVGNTGDKSKIEEQIRVLAEVFNAKINRDE